ncbi:50S ribosomal protein L15 [Candidatus Roizmanbacteria bacterium]|nr:50S ribosomal protein L15 [Candidatus Roizmanbacteria bacterium]
MFLSQLPKTVASKKKRVGRGLGSAKGAKSGRGTTRHQKARESIPLYFEGGQAKLTKKYPLLRGKGKNKSYRPKPVVVHLDVLNIFKAGETVDLAKLVEKRIVKKAVKGTRVKIVANGKLEKKLIIKLPVSHQVKELIVKAGGKVELL